MDFAGGRNGNYNSTLRFRPIAPKPTSNCSASSSITFDGTRTKRRYLRVNRASRCKRKPKTGTSSTKSVPPESEPAEKEIVTLQLLPSDPARAISAPNISSRVRYTESWVTVESVTSIGTLASLYTDDETKLALSRDTCPAFISDGRGNVVEWVNDAYKKVVLMDGTEVDDVTVRLRVEDGVDLFECGAAFTCRVRWRYKGGNGLVERTVLCDTWRMGSGRLAWRLDVYASLSLGLGFSCGGL